MRRIGSGALKQLLSLLPALLWLGCSLAMAAGEPAPDSVQDGASPDRSGFTTGLGEMALSQAFPEAAVWLELEGGDRALGLFYPERESPAAGALVVLADVGSNAASGIMGGLSAQLVERGWAVLAVGLPAPSLALQQTLEARPDTAGQGAGDDDDDSSVMIDVMASPEGESAEQRYRGRVQQSLEAAVDELVGRGYDRPVLLGVGRASGHLVKVQQALPAPGFMIWVAPEFYPGDAATLAEDLPAGIPGVLELYASRISANEELQRRWLSLSRAGGDAYQRQPVSLHQPPSAQDAPALAGRIDAWLRSRQ